VTKGDVGLGAVDNTADAAKPVSTAQALADAGVAAAAAVDATTKAAAAQTAAIAAAASSAALPTASAAGELLRSTGTGTTYVAVAQVDVVGAGLDVLLGVGPAGVTLISTASGTDLCSDAVADLLAATTQAGMRTAVGVAATTLGASWERPDPATIGAGATFIDSNDLSEQVSSGLAASPGVAASGWMRRLPTGLGAGRAGFAGTVPRVFALSLPLSEYTIGNVTLAAMWTWDGTQPAALYAFSEIVTLGDHDNAARGIHLIYVRNGGDTDLAVMSGGVSTVLLASVNNIGVPAGPHSIAIAPVDSSGHKWRFSYDGSTVDDKVMTAPFVPPSATDSVGLGSRPDAVVYLNGRGVELAVWGSLLSDAAILALATLPGTPAYELPESASTGAAAIRIQACRYDPIMSATLMPARGVTKGITIASGVTKVTL